MTDWTIDVVGLLGYGGVALLMSIQDIILPIPSEVIMPAAGFLSLRSGLSIWGIILAGTAGSLIGGLPWYYLGRAMGRGHVSPWIEKHRARLHLHELGRAEQWFSRHGGAAVLLARLLPGVRSLIGIPAGAAGMPLSTFLLYSALGTVVWTGVLAFAGRRLGASFYEFTDILAWMIWAVVGMTALGWWIAHLLRARDAVQKHGDVPQHPGIRRVLP